MTGVAGSVMGDQWCVWVGVVALLLIARHLSLGVASTKVSPDDKRIPQKQNKPIQYQYQV